MTRNTGKQRREPSPSLVVTTFTDTTTVSESPVDPESLGGSGLSDPSVIGGGAEGFIQRPEDSYQVQVDVRKDFRSPLAARKAGWMYQSSFLATVRTTTFRLQAHQCSASELCPKFFSRLQEIHNYALEDEKRKCPSDGVVRVTLTPASVKKVGPSTEDDHPLALIHSMPIVIKEKRCVSSQRIGSKIRSFLHEEPHRLDPTSVTSAPTSSIRGDGSLGINSGAQSQRTIHRESTYEVTTLVHQTFVAPEMLRSIPNYHGESSYYQDVESFKVPPHECDYSEPCSEIAFALYNILNTALDTKRHPFGGDVETWVFPASLKLISARGQSPEHSLNNFRDVSSIVDNSMNQRDAPRPMTPPPKKVKHSTGTYKVSFDVLIKGKAFGIEWTKTFQVLEHECATPEHCPEVLKKLGEVQEHQKLEVLSKNAHLQCSDRDVWVSPKGYPDQISGNL